MEFLVNFSPIIICSNLYSKLFEIGEKWPYNPLIFLQFTKKAQKAILWSRIQFFFFVNVARFARKHFLAYPKLVGTPCRYGEDTPGPCFGLTGTYHLDRKDPPSPTKWCKKRHRRLLCAQRLLRFLLHTSFPPFLPYISYFNAQRNGIYQVDIQNCTVGKSHFFPDFKNTAYDWIWTLDTLEKWGFKC